MEGCEISYRRSFYLPQAVRSIGHSLLTLPAFTLSLLVLSSVNINVFHWIFDVVAHFFSFTWILYSLLFAIIYFPSYLHQHSVLTVTYEQLSSNLDILRFVFSSRCIKRVLMQSITGLIASLIITSQLFSGRYEDLMVYCQPDDSTSEICINDYKLYVVTFTVLISIFSTVDMFIYGRNVLKFGTVNQPVYFHIKSQLLKLSLNSFSFVLSLYKYYFILYLTLGRVYQSVVPACLMINESAGLRYWYSIFDISLTYHTLLCAVFFKLNSDVILLIYQNRLTQSVKFDVSDVDSELSLVNSVRLSRPSLCRLSALIDLSRLSNCSNPSRRSHVYSLSIPGGQPRMWTLISQHINESLTKLIKRLNELAEQSGIAIIKPRGQIETLRSSTALQRGDAAVNVSKKSVSWFKLPTLSSKFPDHICSTYFNDSQIFIYQIQALSGLLKHSINEDKYGIIQQSLSQHITTLINLYEMIEKVSRSVPSLTRRSLDSDISKYSHELSMELRHTVRSSLYQISAAFKPHIQSIEGLSLEHQNRLRNFTQYKE